MTDSTPTPKIKPSNEQYDIKHSIESMGWLERLRDIVIDKLTIKLIVRLWNTHKVK